MLGLPCIFEIGCGAYQEQVLADTLDPASSHMYPGADATVLSPMHVGKTGV